MQYKRVVSFGDSFTYGSDLKDENNWRDNRFYSMSTWPALIAKHYGLDYECYAQAGASNSSILRQVLSAPIQPTDLLIINWTWINRWDFYNGMEWSTVRPSGTENHPMYGIYYKYMQSELWDKFESLKNIQTALSMVNNDTITTSIDPLVVDTTRHCELYASRLVAAVSKHLSWFNGKSFYEWSKECGHPISDAWHPLEEAHQAAFEYIMENKWLNAS
jgi:hypothetical protein